jgi:MFS family permease
LGRVYAFGAAWMGVIVMPVYVPFLTSRGLAVGDVLGLQAVYAMAVMLFEIPTGYVCDVVGRQRAILIGAALNLIGLTAFATVRGFPAYAAVQLGHLAEGAGRPAPGAAGRCASGHEATLPAARPGPPVH